jgi:hypothetical protein
MSLKSMSKKSAWPITVITISVITLFIPIIFEGKTFYAFDTFFKFLPWSSYIKTAPVNNPLITDPVNVFYPNLKLYKTAMRKGSIPLWNPYNFCGNKNHFFFHPFQFISYAIFPETIAHDIVLGLLLFLSGILMYAYLRSIALSSYASIIGALAWMFNGYIMVWFEFENTLMCAASFPALLFAFEYWKKHENILSYLIFLGAFSLAIASSMYSFLAFQLIFFAAYVIYRYSGTKDTITYFFQKKIVLLFGIFGFACIINSGFFIEHFMSYTSGQRSSFSFWSLFQNIGCIPINYLTTLLFPEILNSPIYSHDLVPLQNAQQSYSNFNEMCIYCGIAPLILALIAIRRFEISMVRFYGITALIVITAAMGSILYFPIALVPGMSLSTPTRILFLFGFMIAVLSAIGFDSIQPKIASRGRKIIMTLLLCVGGISLAIPLTLKTEYGFRAISGGSNAFELFSTFPLFSSSLIVNQFLLVSASIIILLFYLNHYEKRIRFVLFLALLMILGLDLVSFGATYNTATPRVLEFPSTPGIQFLQNQPGKYRAMSFGNFFHNTLSAFNIEDIGGYSSFFPRRYGEYLYASQTGRADSIPNSFNRWITFQSYISPLINIVNVKYLLTPPGMMLNNPKIQQVYSGEMTIYENKDAFDRAFFVPAYVFCSSKQEVLQRMVSSSIEDFQKVVFLEIQPTSTDPVSHADSLVSTKSRIEFRRYEPNTVEISGIFPQNGFLVLSDSYFPGWKATLDGTSVPIFLANYFMRAVQVPPGSHTIVFHYAPLYITISIWTSIISWMALAIAIAGILFFQCTNSSNRQKVSLESFQSKFK